MFDGHLIYLHLKRKKNVMIYRIYKIYNVIKGVRENVQFDVKRAYVYYYPLSYL